MRFYLVAQNKIGKRLYKTKLLSPKNFSLLKNELVLKILEEIRKMPQCPFDIAKSLGVHEQKVYYYIRKLEKAGIVSLLRIEPRSGGLAKIYTLSSPSFSFIVDKENCFKCNARVNFLEGRFLEPFIKNGEMNSIIVVGSPDPHGRFGTQATDGTAAIDLALFLGSFLKGKPLPNYKLDTQLTKEDLKKNLILIGGPKSNIIIDKINKKLPLYFDEKNEWNIVSKKSGKVYSEDVTGIIIKTKNPFNQNSKILVLAGKRFKGTRGAIIAIMKYTEILEKEEIAKVIRALDRDGDNIVDDVEFLE